MDEIVKFRAGLAAVLIIFLLWVLTTAVLAQGEPPPPYSGLQNPFPWNDTSAQTIGRELYQPQCSSCHGADGSNLTESDFSTDDYSLSIEQRPDYYFWVLSEGRPDKGMPAYKSSLSEEQRWQVLTYIWLLGKEGLSQEVVLPEVASLSEPDIPLDCLSHHTQVLKGHDKLGEGSEAYWACHLSTQMTTLHLAGGETEFSLSDSPRLCAQCQQKRSEAWHEGTHGVSAWKEGSPEVRGSEKEKCTSCHNPHRPQVTLLNITKPHPAPAPPPPPPPVNLLMILGISLVSVIALGVAVVRKGEWPWN